MNNLEEIIQKEDKIALRRELLSKEINLNQARGLVEISKAKGTKIIEAILINQIPDALNFYSVEERKQLIVDALSELSEDIYAAGWYDNIEYELWEWTENKVPDSISQLVEEEDLIDLRKMSEKLNLWAIWDEDKEGIAISLDEWKLLYQQ